MEKIYPFIEGFDGKYGFGQIVFVATDTEPSNPVHGTMYYDDSEEKYKYYNGSSWVAIAAAGAATTGLDGAYDLNNTITVDGNAVTLAANGSIGMTITQATNYAGLYVNNTAGTGNAIDIQNAGTGYDIQGSDDSWSIDKTGALVVTAISGFGDLTCEDITATASSVSITTDATTGVAMAIEADTITTGTALEIDTDAGAGCTILDLQNASTSVLTVGGTGIVTIAGSAEGTSYLVITDGDITLTDGDLNITEGNVAITGDANADVVGIVGAATGNYDVMSLDGSTSAGSGSILKIAQGAGARTGHAIDVNMGATGVAMSALDVSCTGGTRTVPIININSDGTASDFIHCETSGVFTGNMINLVQDTGAGSGNFIFINNDTGTSMEAINIDDEANVEDIVLITATGNTGAANALINLVANGTPNATANALLVNYSGITATNTPYAVKIDASGVDAGALTIDTDAATDSGVVIHGGGATANNTAVLEINWDGTPANAGSNLVRIDGSGGTNTAKPVLVEIYDDSVAVGLSVSTASIEDMVTFIGTGATGAAKSVVDITSTALINATGNLLRLDLTGADTTNVPTALQIVGNGETARGLYIDTDGTTVGAAAFHSGGALTNGVGVVNITNDGNLATGGNLLNITVGGTPHAAAIAAEIVAAKDCQALVVTSSAATDSAVEITGAGAMSDDKAILEIGNTGTMVAGSSMVRIASATAAAGATVYGLEIACNATNLEGLNVSAGTSLFAEAVTMSSTLAVTGQITATAGVQGILGTAANLTDTTPTDAEFSTAFGVGNKTKGGFTGIVEDSDSGVAYLVASDGTTWHFVTLTAAAT
jgi:hypothetical protein